jgi:putative membrane protein
MAIQHYTDHAANERTFLAWVRTSISIIALGFLVERFDLFVASLVPASSAVKTAIAVPREQFGHIAGLVLIIAGIVMIAVSAWRFRRTAMEIDSTELHPGTGRRADYALAILLILLSAGLLFYLFHAVTKSA